MSAETALSSREQHNHHSPSLWIIAAILFVILIVALAWGLVSRQQAAAPAPPSTGQSQLQTHNTSGTSNGSDPNGPATTRPSPNGASSRTSTNPKVDQ